MAEPTRKLYKVIADGRSIHGGDLEWSLPADGQPGEWRAAAGPIVICKNGIHLTWAPAEWFSAANCQVFEAEGEEPGGEAADRSKAVYRRARLLREITDHAELAQLGIYKSGKHSVAGSAKVTASGSAQVTAFGSAQVTASGSAQVMAYGSAQVTASGSAQVMAYGSAQVTAFGSAQVTAYGSAQVTAYGSAQVTAYGSAQVTAYGSAQVTAYGSAQVTAFGSAQVTASHKVCVIFDSTYWGANSPTADISDDAVIVDRRKDRTVVTTARAGGEK